MSDVDKLIIQINDKIKKLIGVKQALLIENKNLTVRQADLLLEIQNKNRIIDELRNKNRNLSIAESVKQIEGNSDVRLKIDEMVREIDKCIELLNK
jgi:hypothetical protein